MAEFNFSKPLKSKKRRNNLIFKIFWLAVCLVLGISYLYNFLLPQKFSHTQKNFLADQFSILMRIPSDFLANGKASYWYNWQNINYAKIATQASFIVVRSDSKKPYRDLENKYSFKNTFAHFGLVEDAAIIEPVSYKRNWSLVFCLPEKRKCQQNNMKYTGRIKILVDGQQEIVGLTENGDFIQLKLVKYINRNEENSILFV